MTVMTEIIDADRLSSIFEIPEEMRHRRVEVTIRPFPVSSEKTKPKVNMELLNKFRNAGFDFKEHLRQKLAEGYQFDFDAQKVIDGTETEEEMQARFRSEKNAWADDVAERVRNGTSE
ncbi:hypothetical protein FACS1894137_01360 [Spirochaetia bacterium]|nr:hypothetical protein FACS1894137_01360 [Spirochaetia bacterium]